MTCLICAAVTVSSPRHCLGWLMDEFMASISIPVCLSARHEIELAGVRWFSWSRAARSIYRRWFPEKVDYVLLANTFHGVSEQTALSELVHAALKDGGLFGIINWYPKPPERTPCSASPAAPSTETGMSPEAVRKVVEPAGFTLERVVELPAYHYGAIFRKNSQSAA